MKETPKDLETLRSEIDAIDEKLIRLLSDRAHLVAAVGEWKREHQKPIYDPHREAFILEKIQRLNSGPLPNTILVKLFSELVSHFRQWEFMSQELHDLHTQIQWIKSKKIGIIGLGLLGFSFALRLKKICPEVEIFGYDPDSNNHNLAQGMIATQSSILEVIEKSDIVVLATPVLVIEKILRDHELQFQQKELIFDLASTKKMICEQAKNLNTFIGAHPLAGKALSGAAHADPQLFSQRPFVMCPTPNTAAGLIESLKMIIELLGAVPYQMSPNFHDEMLALTSHLPQMIATNLTAMSSDLYQLMGDPFLYGPAFSEMTRCASSNLKMWEDIVKTNKENIQEMIVHFIQRLTEFQKSIEQNNIQKSFEDAKQFKNYLIKK